MTEAEVTKQVLEFLTERGWRCLRMQSGLFKSTSGGKAMCFYYEPA